jgi:hypothetical protein
LHDSYTALDFSNYQDDIGHKFLTVGNLGFLNQPATRINAEVTQNLDRLYFLRSEINKSAKTFTAGPGFIESFQDWKSNELNHVTLGSEPDRVFQSGMLDLEGQKKYWAQNFERVWTDSLTVTLAKQNSHVRTNFFSIFTFFAAIVFFAIYQRQTRLRENFRRSMKHPYNFFVDMRERRIIPLFNSILIGAFSALLLAITLASVIYYYHNFFGLQEIFAIFLSPAGIFDSFLMLIASKWKLTGLIFIILFLYPLFVSTILKLIGMFSIERIRFRQSLAIGLWSGIPLIFILPLSLSVYHLLYMDFYVEYVLFIIFLFILWAHWRILTGIRVLFITRPAKVFIIMLLSYIIPLIIFWAVFKPYPYWFEYFKFLLSAQNLY